MEEYLTIRLVSVPLSTAENFCINNGLIYQEVDESQIHVSFKQNEISLPALKSFISKAENIGVSLC